MPQFTPTIAGHGDRLQVPMLTTLVLASAAVLPQQDRGTAPQHLPSVSQAVVQDDMRGYVRPQDLTGPFPSDAGLEDSTLQPRKRSFIAKVQDGALAPNLSGLSARNMLTEVHAEASANGDIWARGRDYRASFGPDGFTMWPIFGKQSPREFPVVFSLGQVSLGGEALPTLVGATQLSEGTVEIGQGSLREVYYLDLNQIEQTFVFDQLPGQGDLVVTLDVSTELSVMQDSTNIRFVHDEFGEVTYGQAFVTDASGRKVSIERTWNGSGITLTVPASFVASAQLPLVIDPPVTSLSNTWGVDDDLAPDIIWDGNSDLWMVVWQEYTSATNSDCVMTSFTHGGVQGPIHFVDSSADAWSNPRIASSYGPDRLLIVASVEAGGIGGSGSINGRLFDGLTDTFVGTDFIISTTGFRKLYPDVGGSNQAQANSAHFCVVWSFENGPGSHNAQYRVIDSDGANVTNIVTVDGVGEDEIHTTISDGWGDADIFGDFWTMAWMKDTGAAGNDLGSIHARRIVWHGDPNSGGGNIVVESSTNCAYPSISSRLDDVLVANGQRPAIVAYERQFATLSGPTPTQRSIYARVIAGTDVFSSNSLSLTLEDVDSELDQRDACVATDGDSFYIVYSEEFYANVGGGDYDMYMVSGHLSETSSGAFLGLAERHQNMAFSFTPERFGRVATKWEGETASTSDDGCVFWLDHTGANGGLIEGTTLEVPTVDTSDRGSVGIQYCDANDNGGPTDHAFETSSWIWIQGTQDRNDTHTVHCVDVTPSQFGYLLAALSPTSINLPGGSAGRLCVSGAGRYTNMVQSSGINGTYSTIIDPMHLPQPMGNVSAAPGETWYFQYWHRDFINGMPTSNFSNAARLTFNP
ncbi:MAG: hypothetical protein ACI8QC_000098 [Planctomycetota bacterium]|jgi:hypothetical protein